MSPFRFFFCVLLFLVGAGVSFVIPFVRDHAGHEASLVFGCYFAALVVSELVTYRVDAIRHWRFGVAFTSLLYTGSFVVMAFVTAPLGLVLGRTLEGVAVGARMPLLFRDAMTAEVKSRDAMLAALNSLYAVGYVCGPFVADVALLGLSQRGALVAFGAVTLVVAVAMEAARPGAMGLEKEATASSPPVHRFLLLFVAKVAYGFLLVSITSANRPHFFSDRMSLVLFAIAGVLMIGQAIGVRVVKWGTIDAVGASVTAILAASCAAYALCPGTTTLLVAALVQGVVLFVAVRAVGLKASDSKTYALFNALSDPGSILGALIGSLGTRGAFLAALLATIPMSIHVAARARARSHAG